MSEEPISGVKWEGEFLHMKIHKSRVHGLRVAIRPVRVGETVSKSTQDLRDGFDRALAQAQVKGKP